MKKILSTIGNGAYDIVIGAAIIFGILIIGGMLFGSFVLFNVPASQFIDENPEMLQVGEVWTVEDQFSLWIDSVEEVPAEMVKAYYPDADVEDSEGTHYFDITFSFQNDNFEGCKSGEQFDEYLGINVAVNAAGEENISGFIPDCCRERPYCTAIVDGQEVPVTKGILSTNNHVFIVLDDAELEKEAATRGKITHLRIRYLAPIEILSSEAAIQYAQNFYYPLPK